MAKTRILLLFTNEQSYA